MNRPVTFQQLFGGGPLDPVDDPYPVYARLRHSSPATPIASAQGRSAYLVTRYDDVRAILKDEFGFSSRLNAESIGVVFGRTIIEMDGREHLRHRNLVTPALAPRALKGAFPQVVAAIAHEIIDGFADAGRVDLVQGFTFNYPLSVFTRILGLPTEDHGALHDLAIALSHVTDDPARALSASRDLAERLLPVVRARRSEPSDDLISRLAQAEVEGEHLDDEEIVSFLRLLVSAGAETTYHLIGTAMYALLSNPRALEEVLADRSLVQRVLDETLRWETPVQIIPREVVDTTSIGGIEVPAGAHLTLSIGSANRDEKRFDRPDQFDLHRDWNEHISFGFGKHYCAGSRLAYLEAQVAIDALLDRLPGLRFDPDQGCKVVGLAFRSPNRLPVRFG